MKKIFTLALALSLLLVLAACKPEEAQNELPVLAGIDGSVTVNVGDTWNPLDGVTASDAEDGDLTSSITVDNLDCLDLGSDNVVPASAGGANCTLVYRVEDSAGGKAQKNSSVTVEVVVDVTTNALVNGDFELGANGWTNTDSSLLDLHNGAVGSAEVVGGELVVTVVTPSWDGGSAPRVNQEGLDFENGKTYEVSFDAKANVADLIVKTQVGVLLSSDPWFTPYYYNPDGDAFEFTMTTEYQTFSYKFTVTEATTDNGTVTFELGANAVGDADFMFYFDNMVVKESTPDADTLAPVFSGLEAATVGLEDGFDALDGVSFYDVDTTLTNADIVITHDGGADVTMETDGTYSFAALGVYTFTYVLTDADSNTATETREVTVNAMVYEQPWELQGAFTAVADADSVVFTYADTPDPAWWSNLGVFRVERFDGTVTTQEFVFTGVSGTQYMFKVETEGANIETFIVADGTEQTVTADLSAWTEAQRDMINVFAFFVSTPGASGSVDVMHPMYTEKDYPEMWIGFGFTSLASMNSEEVTYDAVGDPWWNSNAQYTVTGFDGTETHVKFEFIGVLDQAYMIKVENGTDNIETNFTGTGDAQFVVVDLSGWTEAQRAAMSLFVLFVPEVGASGSIEVLGWSYGEVPAPAWVVYNALTLVIDEDSALITYDAHDASWDNNAQLALVLDGTENSIDLTVIGTLGHNFKLKIEGGGVSTEVDFVGTGVSQVVTLDLSSFTEAQIQGLNLFVLFPTYMAGDAGSIDIFGWEYTPTT